MGHTAAAAAGAEASATICNDFWCAATGFAQFLRVHYHTNGEYSATATCHMPHTHTSRVWTQTKVNFLMPAPKRFYLALRCEAEAEAKRVPCGMARTSLEPHSNLARAWPDAPKLRQRLFIYRRFFMI